MQRHTLRTSLSAVIAVFAVGHAADALAQQPPLALERFTPAPAGDRLFGVPSPYVAGHGQLHLMLLGDYAHDPLVLVRESDDATLASTVEHQLFLHLNASFALWDRLSIDLDVPMAVVQEGDTVGGIAGASGAAFGDVRLGGRLRLVGDYYDPFQLGIGGYVWLPTGDDSGFVSDGAARGMPYLSVGGRVPRFFWTVASGVEVRRAQALAGISQGTMLQVGGGFGFLLGDDEQVQIGPEANVSFTLDDVQSRTTNAEVLLDARYRAGDFELGAGAGPGLSSGIGTPDFRAIAMFAYSPRPERGGDRDGDGFDDALDACPDLAGIESEDPLLHGCPAPSDRDGDGIADASDACPDEKGVASGEPAKNGCPLPSDRDGDGIVDTSDACPDETGVASDDPTKHGCPPDRDGDGVVDEKDACPELAGVATDDPATNGCPGDRDGDGVRDDQDACPDEKGIADADASKNGCPRAVRVTETEVLILQQVQFDTAKSSIRRESDALLDEVAQVLKEHPEITKMEVQGHTDDRGGKQLNATLSKARAKSVMDALVRRGIEASRLSSQGFGQDKPVADNTSPEGRQKNRRVQFIILEKKPKVQR